MLQHWVSEGEFYSTSRRSLRVRPDAGRVWKIFPPTHCTHEYLVSVHHRASASVRLRPCVCIRASACPSARLRVHLCFCVSVRPSVCPSVRLQVGPCGPCVCRSGTNIYMYIAVVAGKCQSAEVAIVRVLTYLVVRVPFCLSHTINVLRGAFRGSTCTSICYSAR